MVCRKASYSLDKGEHGYSTAQFFKNRGNSFQTLIRFTSRLRAKTVVIRDLLSKTTLMKNP
jgi:hypothetical protein